jgi:hypothetical protein
LGFEVNELKVKGQTGHEKLLTTQYLEVDNSLLDGHQTLYTGKLVDDPY